MAKQQMEHVQWPGYALSLGQQQAWMNEEPQMGSVAPRGPSRELERRWPLLWYALPMGALWVPAVPLPPPKRRPPNSSRTHFAARAV